MTVDTAEDYERVRASVQRAVPRRAPRDRGAGALAAGARVRLLLVPAIGRGLGSGHLRRCLALARRWDGRRPSCWKTAGRGAAATRRSCWRRWPAENLCRRLCRATIPREPWDLVLLDGFRTPAVRAGAIRGAAGDRAGRGGAGAAVSPLPRRHPFGVERGASAQPGQLRRFWSCRRAGKAGLPLPARPAQLRRRGLRGPERAPAGAAPGTRSVPARSSSPWCRAPISGAVGGPGASRCCVTRACGPFWRATTWCSPCSA